MDTLSEMLMKISRADTLTAQDLVVEVIESYELTGSLLGRLRRDKCESLRLLAAVKWTSPRMLSKMAKDVSPVVRGAVAANTHSDSMILGTFLHDSDPTVRLMAVLNLNCTRRQLGIFAKDKEQDVRDAVSIHPLSAKASHVH